MIDASLTSIVVPVFNAAKTLEDAVRSVQGQTVQDWELILVEDGSHDGSVELVNRLAAEDARIRPVFHPTNRGAAAARNTGVLSARGRRIAFLDSDDLWHPRKLEAQLAAMDAADADISFTDYEWIDLVGRSLGIVIHGPDSPTWQHLTWGNDIGLSTSIIDRLRVGDPLMPEIRLNHDYAMWLGLLRKGFKAVHVPETLVSYRMVPGSLSQNKFDSARHNWRILHDSMGLPVWQVLPRMAVWSLRSAFRRLRAQTHRK